MFYGLDFEFFRFLFSKTFKNASSEQQIIDYYVVIFEQTLR